ncbi:MAG TPA: hypothetical protein VFH48_09365 [Chloroflexota bacterium]|nr:hypothetical protein [Chloroflexota bacterium]
MAGRVTLVVGIAVVALIVVASLLWWPSIVQALQSLHGPPPGAHGPR